VAVTWARAHWRRLFAIGNVLLLLGLIGAALWISLRPSSPTRSSTSGPSPVAGTGSRSPATGPAGVTRTPVFTVAPSYPASVPLTPTQALLTGHVFDAGNKSPLAGAEVNIDAAGGKLTIHTDAAGQFTTAVETARPFGFTVDAPKHGGGVGFGKLCPGDKKDVAVPLPAAGGPPAAPIALQGSKC